MMEHILFLTGKLAEKRLHSVLESMQPHDFTYEISAWAKRLGDPESGCSHDQAESHVQLG